MNSEVVDFLMSQPNGASYVVLYQMLCLKTNQYGWPPYLSDKAISSFRSILGRFSVTSKYFTLDTIRVALGL